jgi:hypothetical protein
MAVGAGQFARLTTRNDPNVGLSREWMTTARAGVCEF